MELRYKISIVGSVLFAHFYALIERAMVGGNPLEAFRNKFFSQFPVVRGVTAYQYVFMFSLFFIIGSLPLWKSFIREGGTRRVGIFLFGNRVKILWFALGNALLTGIVEDAAYFYLYGEWIQAGDWTTNIIGYLQVGGFTVPLWYPLLGAIIVTCYLTALRMNEIETRATKILS